MDIQKAFTFITEDETWIQKLAIGVGVVLASTILSVVIVGLLGYLILGGYTIRLLQNVRDGAARPLPEWDDWGGDLGRGFKYMVVGFIWGLPLVLLTVPSTIGGALADSGGGDFTEFIGGVIVICSGCLSLVYGIFMALAQPGFTISFARDEKISSGLMLTDIWQWTRQNLGQVVIVSLVVIGAGLVLSLGASVIGALLCIVGLIVTIPLAVLVMSLVQHHLYGQLARTYPMYPVRSNTMTPAGPAPVAPAGNEPISRESTMGEAEAAYDMPGQDVGMDGEADVERAGETAVAAATETVDQMVEDVTEEVPVEEIDVLREEVDTGAVADSEVDVEIDADSDDVTGGDKPATV